MPKSRMLVGALATGALVLASLFAAAPANAATLPEGQKISVLTDENWGQFYDVNHNTGALTAVGEGDATEGDIFTGVDVNDDGVGYAITTSYTTPPPDPDCTPDPQDPDCTLFQPDVPTGAYLYDANAKTGDLEFLDTIRFFFAPDVFSYMDECTGIDYSGGELYLACSEYDDETEGELDLLATYIGVWDFDLEAAIPLIELDGHDAEQGDFDAVPLTAIAVDPISGELYGFGIDCDGGCLYPIYTLSEDEGATFVANAEQQIYGADFDSSGQLWGTTQMPQAPPNLIPDGDGGLVTVNLTNGVFTSATAWVPQKMAVIQPITVWGKILPATGPADSPAPLIAIGLLLLGGTILAGVTVLRRRPLVERG